jgi:thiamine pyrophosphate-dependent acetolactate synthase large subunit-like protein
LKAESTRFTHAKLSDYLVAQPGYLEIHRDMVECEIPVPKEIVSWNGELPHLQSDRRKLDEAVRDTAERLSRAQRPLVLVGTRRIVSRLRERSSSSSRKWAFRAAPRFSPKELSR